jgi:hypothetical protein
VPSFVLYARGRHSHIAARSAPISSSTHFNEAGGTRIRAKRSALKTASAVASSPNVASTAEWVSTSREFPTVRRGYRSPQIRVFVTNGATKELMRLIEKNDHLSITEHIAPGTIEQISMLLSRISRA